MKDLSLLFFTATDREIDRLVLVYDLYSLTEAEIVIVEEVEIACKTWT